MKTSNTKRVNGWGFFTQEGDLYNVELWRDKPEGAIPVIILYSLPHKKQKK